MAILGTGGILELSREWPEPMALATEAISHSVSPPRILLDNPKYWTGDRVILCCSAGVPFDVNGDGYADNPDGHGIYRGGEWLTGPSRAYYTGSETDDSPFYAGFSAYLVTQDGANNITTQGGDQFLAYTGQDGGKYFYNRVADTGNATQFDAYIHVDDLDRIRLFSDAPSAYNLDTGSELTPLKVKTGNFAIARYSSASTYTTALDSAANSIAPLTLPSTSQELQDVITVPSGMTSIADDPDFRGWLVQCDLQEWAFSVDAANLDMTAIGETFGENAKSLVRGAGSLTFLVDQRYVDGEQTSMTLLRLVTLTEKQAKSSAKFHIYKDRTPTSPQVGKTAYYGCDVLLTNTRINVRADDIITGTADFVATGEIALKFAP